MSESGARAGRSRTVAVIRGLAALLGLLAGLVGVPWLLVALTAALAPVLAGWSEPLALLTRGDPAAILVGLLWLGAWLGWLVFVVGVITELITLASGYRIQIRLPGLAGVQRLAAGLLISVVAMLATTQASSADPAPPAPTALSGALPAAGDDRPARAEQPAATRAAAPSRSERARTAPDGGRPTHVHVVERGDDLWSLARRYYGNGSDWRRIAAANPDRLSGGPDRLEAGWRLAIPGVDAEQTRRPAREMSARSAHRDKTVVVHRDDTLSHIAEREYGAQRRWPILWNANRDRLDDPDELTIGMRLVVPYRERWDPARRHSAHPKSAAPKTANPKQPAVRPTASEGPQASSAGNGGSTCAPPTSDKTPAGSASPTPEAVPPPAGGQPNPPPLDPRPLDPGPLDPAVLPAGLGSAGALLAAAVIAGLGLRRRQQLQARPVGRRILHPSEAAQRVETALGRRARPLGLRSLDLATRAISAHCHLGRHALPVLTVATVTDERIDLRWAGPTPPPPAGLQAVGNHWVLDQANVPLLKTVPGLGDAVRPYPALVTLGLDASGRPVVADLEALGLLSLQTDDLELVEATLTAMALELAFSPWAEEMILTLVGWRPELPAALGRHNVSHVEDVDALLRRLEARARVQRTQLAADRPGRQRVDPDLADPWAPEIVLFSRPLDPDQERWLHQLLADEPRVTTAAVFPRTGITETEWNLRLRRPGPGTLEPLDLQLTTQLVEARAAEAVLELLSVTGSDVTTPAPWWSAASVDDIDPDPPPDNVSYLGLSHPRRFGGWADGPNERQPSDGEAAQMIGDRGVIAESAMHPTLLLLGPLDLVGAAGDPPPRAEKQCLEYCGWLLEHPGSTAQAMGAALSVAEGTRRSNMSRLRSWLGQAADGKPYLPDAYSGRIALHTAVSSDWQRLQIQTAGGMDRSSTAALRAALRLVRGAPLADAAPGQWHWAEELRTDMISAVRDLGVELANRALLEHDIDLARWAASRALAAAPGDELLMVARIRTEHQAGHRSEVERLTLQIAAQARQIGVDLAPETVTVLQEVLEGRPRARMA